MADDPNKPDPSEVAKGIEQDHAAGEQQAESSTPTVAGEMPTADHQHAQVKANQAISHASSVDGQGIRGGRPLVPEFNEAASPPTPPAPPQLTPIFNAAGKPPNTGGSDGPKPQLRPPDGPSPGGSGSGPAPSTPSTSAPETKEAFKKRMLTRQFNEKARDITRDR